MRFLAKMVSDDPNNKDREFSVIFSLVDDEIKVWENQTDGFGKGFVYKSPYQLKRGKPDYSPMYVGSIVNINGVKYELYDAPENSYETMESHPEEFPFMDTKLIAKKLKPYYTPLKNEFKKCIIPETDRVLLEDATEIITKCEAHLNKSEVIAVVRKFRFYKTKTYSFEELLTYIA